LKDKGKGSALI